LAATVHCLTGCAIGEVLGMALGTALGWSIGATVVASIVLAFVFGYGLTSVPLLRAGLPLRRVVPLALASDTPLDHDHGDRRHADRARDPGRSTQASRTRSSGAAWRRARDRGRRRLSGQPPPDRSRQGHAVIHAHH
jgi:hypothetical protein